MARFAAPNIMVGNTMLIKHASIVPQCAIAIEHLFLEAGAPNGLYTNLLISGERASALVSDHRIKGVSLTGSEAAGASIAIVAGKHLKKSVLELGGSDAFIVLEDADIDKAVEWAVVKNEQAAIDLANDSPFGLGGSVFTQDIERGKRVADQIDT
ncbi:unnamed protein product, partial [Darwinula stevensoni]